MVKQSKKMSTIAYLLFVICLSACKSVGTTSKVLNVDPSLRDTPAAGSWGYCGTDVTGLLDSSLLELREKWDVQHVDDKIAICSSMASAGGWDINEFFLAGWGNRNEKNAKYRNSFASNQWGRGQCEGTVTYQNQCYWAAELNYILWGYARRMCDDYQRARSIDKKSYLGVSGYYYKILKSSYGFGGETTPAYPLDAAVTLVQGWRLVKYGVFEGRLLETKQPKYRRVGLGTDERIAWTRAGWFNDPRRALSTNISSACTPSSEAYRNSLLIFIGTTTSKGTASLSGQFSETSNSINLIRYGDFDNSDRNR